MKNDYDILGLELWATDEEVNLKKEFYFEKYQNNEIDSIEYEIIQSSFLRISYANNTTDKHLITDFKYACFDIFENFEQDFTAVEISDMISDVIENYLNTGDASYFTDQYKRFINSLSKITIIKLMLYTLVNYITQCPKDKDLFTTLRNEHKKKTELFLSKSTNLNNLKLLVKFYCETIVFIKNTKSSNVTCLQCFDLEYLKIDEMMKVLEF